MSKNAKIAAGGVAAGLILLIWLPWWAALLIVLGVPAAASAFHVGKLVAQCRDTGVGQTLGDGLECGVAHVCARAVSQHEQRLRVRRAEQ